MQESPYEREPGYAERYRDRRFQSGTGRRTDTRERRAIRRLLRIASPPAGPWLDAPCGAGRLTDELPAPCIQVDRDPAMVQALPGSRPRTCASVHTLPFADNAFAGTLCMRLLQHIATPAERVAILRELARVTRGPIILSFFDSCSLQHLRRQLRPLMRKRRSGRHAVGRRSFRAELGQVGLQATAMHSLTRFFGEQTVVLAEQKIG